MQQHDIRPAIGGLPSIGGVAPGEDRSASGQGWDAIAKMVFDKVAAGAALVFFGPVMLTVILALLRRGEGPILFAHPRIGKDGRVFYCLKFRTMHADADRVLARHLARDPAAAAEWRATQKLRQDPRVTPLGAFLRQTSLDELPQLLNILRGEMSIVGPRPITAAEAARYGAALADYLSVRPGLTGLWQISGRSDLSYAERVRLDRAYVRSRSFWRDLAIIWRTMGVVLRRQGSC